MTSESPSFSPRILLLAPGCRFNKKDPLSLASGAAKGRVYIASGSSKAGSGTATASGITVKDPGSFAPDTSCAQPGCRMFDAIHEASIYEAAAQTHSGAQIEIDLLHTSASGQPELIARHLLNALVVEKRPYNAVFASCKGVPQTLDALEKLAEMMGENNLKHPPLSLFLGRAPHLIPPFESQIAPICEQISRDIPGDRVPIKKVVLTNHHGFGGLKYEDRETAIEGLNRAVEFAARVVSDQSQATLNSKLNCPQYLFYAAGGVVETAAEKIHNVSRTRNFHSELFMNDCRYSLFSPDPELEGLDKSLRLCWRKQALSQGVGLKDAYAVAEMVRVGVESNWEIQSAENSDSEFLAAPLGRRSGTRAYVNPVLRWMLRLDNDDDAQTSGLDSSHLDCILADPEHVSGWCFHC